MTSNSSHPPASMSNGQAAPVNEANPFIETRWERPVVAASGGDVTLLVRVTAPPAPQIGPGRAAPLDVAFVLDRSGSMHGGKLDLAKAGVDLAVARLRDKDRVALVVYDNEVDTVQSLAAATPRLKASLRLALHGIDPRGSTFLSGGWVAGCQELAEASPVAGEPPTATRIRRTILLTDGLANAGILDSGELARHAGAVRQRGIATTTIGVGHDFDEGLLSAMAEAGGGNFQYVADPAGLRAFFATELEELFSVAATGVTISLALPPGLAVELVSAFPVATREDGLEVAIGDLPAGDEIDLVFTIRAAAGAAGEQIAVGVNARWTDPRADARREAGASPLPLRRVTQHEVAATIADAMVSERAALQRAAAERRAGLELDRAGRFAESRSRMAAAYDLLEVAPMTDSVRFDLAESAFLAAAPSTASYGSQLRKSAQHREGQRRRGRVDHAGKDANGS